MSQKMQRQRRQRLRKKYVFCVYCKKQISTLQSYMIVRTGKKGKAHIKCAKNRVNA